MFNKSYKEDCKKLSENHESAIAQYDEQAWEYMLFQLSQVRAERCLKKATRTKSLKRFRRAIALAKKNYQEMFYRKEHYESKYSEKLEI